MFPQETNSNGVGSQPGQTTPTLPTTTGDTETGNKTTPSIVHTGSGYGRDKTGAGLAAGIIAKDDDDDDVINLYKQKS